MDVTINAPNTSTGNTDAIEKRFVDKYFELIETDLEMQNNVIDLILTTQLILTFLERDDLKMYKPKVEEALRQCEVEEILELRDFHDQQKIAQLIVNVVLRNDHFIAMANSLVRKNTCVSLFMGEVEMVMGLNQMVRTLIQNVRYISNILFSTVNNKNL